MSNNKISLYLIFFHLLAWKPNLEKISMNVFKQIFSLFSLVRVQFYLSRALCKWVIAKTARLTDIILWTYVMCRNCHQENMYWKSSVSDAFLWVKHLHIVEPTNTSLHFVIFFLYFFFILFLVTNCLKFSLQIHYLDVKCH